MTAQPNPAWEPLTQALFPELPPIIFRDEVPALFKGQLSRGSLANEDSRGTGPRERRLWGKRVCYPRESFLDWFNSKLKQPEVDRARG